MMDKSKNSFDNYPDWLLTKWQEMADLLADLLSVSSCLIMKSEYETMEVFTSSQSDNNPYHKGDHEKWYGLYCETVIKTQTKLSIANATKDSAWDKNPDIKLGMIAYLGFPINFPDSVPFGTLCVLDNKERAFSPREEKLLQQFKNVIELDLALLQSFDLKANESAKTILEQQAQLRDQNRELLQAKEIAQESESRFRLLIDNIMHPVLVTSFDGRMLYMNQKTADFLDVKFDDCQGLKSQDIWVDPTKRIEYIMELRQNGSVQNQEVQFRNQQGRIITALISSNIIDYYGEKAIFSIYNNITERKDAEKGLLQSEARLNALIDTMPDLVWLKDENGAFMYCNRRFEQFVGASKAQIVGKTDYDFVTKELADFFREKDKHAIAAGTPSVNEESVVFASDGHCEILETIKMAINREDGHLLGVLGIGRNITQRKLGEESLIESQRKLTTLIGNLPGLAYRCKNDPDWTMIFMSEGCLELTGFSRDELEGNHVISYGNLVHPDDAEMVWDKVQEGILNHRQWQVEYRIQTKEGLDKWVWEKGCGVYDKNGDLELLEGFITDITERKTSELALVESEILLSSVINSTPDYIWSVDIKDFRLLTFNTGMKNFFASYLGANFKPGLTPKDIFFVEKLGQMWIDVYQLVIAKGSHSFEYTTSTGKNTIHYSLNLLKHGDTIFGISGFGRDITEQKVAEKALQESEAKYRYIVDNSPVGIFQRTMQGQYNYCNITLANSFDCDTIEEFLKHYNEVATRWANPDKYAEFKDLLLRNGKVLGFEVETKLIGGKTKWFSLYSFLDASTGLLNGFSLDITEGKEARMALKESEIKYYEAIEFLPIPIGIAMGEEIVYLNKEFTNSYGYTLEDIGTLNDWTLKAYPDPVYRKEATERWGNDVAHAMQTKTITPRREYLVSCKDLSLKWVVITAAMAGDQLITTFENITERKKNEAVLMKLYTAINHSRVSIVITDSEGVIEFANPYFTQITGYSNEEYLGKTPRILKSDIQDAEVYKKMWDTIKSGNTWEGELCNRKKNGELFWEKSIITPIINDKQELLNFVAVKSDITNDKKHKYLNDITLEIYEKSEYLSIEEILKYSIELGLRLTDSEIGFFHFVNPDQETISLQAWSAKTMDICNVPQLDMHYPISSAGVWVDCFYKKGAVAHNDYEALPHKEGLPHGHAPLTRDLSVPVLVENQVVAIFGVGNKSNDYSEVDAEHLSIFAENVWNIIRRKKAETETLKAKEKAELSDRLKTQFLLNMSHEVRTPMNAINGFSGMLNNADLTEEKRSLFTSIIISSSNQLQSIVDNILTISLLETKQEKIYVEPVSINSLLSDLYDPFLLLAQKQNLTLMFHAPLTDRASEVYSDKTKLVQTLSNLIGNALKFTREGSVEYGYQLTAPHGADGATPSGVVELQFYVKDTGIGIQPHLQEQIFERFIQAETGLTRSYGGNGLGLSISKGFVELLGGRIWVESDFGKGSTFYFTIPYQVVLDKDHTN